MTTPGGSFGKAIANLVADALRQTLLAVLPAAHAEKWRQANQAAEHTASSLHVTVHGIAEAMDRPELHPALRPLVDILKKGSE